MVRGPQRSAVSEKVHRRLIFVKIWDLHLGCYALLVGALGDRDDLGARMSIPQSYCAGLTRLPLTTWAMPRSLAWRAITC